MFVIGEGKSVCGEGRVGLCVSVFEREEVICLCRHGGGGCLYIYVCVYLS